MCPNSLLQKKTVSCFITYVRHPSMPHDFLVLFETHSWGFTLQSESCIWTWTWKGQNLCGNDRAQFGPNSLSGGPRGVTITRCVKFRLQLPPPPIGQGDQIPGRYSLVNMLLTFFVTFITNTEWNLLAQAYYMLINNLQQHSSCREEINSLALMHLFIFMSIVRKLFLCFAK